MAEFLAMVSRDGFGLPTPAGYTPLNCAPGAMTNVEARAQTKLRDSYTLKKLLVVCHLNTLMTATFTIRKNVVNGNQTVSIGSGATGEFQDDVHTDAFISGDYMATCATYSGTGSLAFSLISYVLAGSSSVLSFGYNADDRLGSSSTYYWPVNGMTGTTPTSNENAVKYTSRIAATLSHMKVYIITNPTGSTSTFNMRLNGANGNLAVSVGAGATGEFEDNAHTDSMSQGDTFNYRCVTGSGTSGIWVATTSVKFSHPAQRIIAEGYCWQSGYTDVPSGTTYYFGLEGDFGYPTAAANESRIRTRTRLTGFLKNLFVNVPGNTLNGAATIRTRKNSGNGNLSVTVGAGATGTFEDTVNSDSLLPTDRVNYQVATGGTSGTLKVSIIGVQQGQESRVLAGSTAYRLAAVGAI